MKDKYIPPSVSDCFRHCNSTCGSNCMKIQSVLLSPWKRHVCTSVFYTALLLSMFVSKQPTNASYPLCVEKDAVAGCNSSLKEAHPHSTALSTVDVSCCTVDQLWKVDRQCTCRSQLWTTAPAVRHSSCCRYQPAANEPTESWAGGKGLSLST